MHDLVVHSFKCNHIFCSSSFCWFPLFSSYKINILFLISNMNYIYTTISRSTYILWTVESIANHTLKRIHIQYEKKKKWFSLCMGLKMFL